jgi:hypothetical protein
MYDSRTMTTPNRRRSDRVLDPSFVEGLSDLQPEEVRSRLADARAEEEELSYLRRLVHGELDILRAELQVRGEGGTAQTDLVQRLTSILGSGPERSSRGARARVAPPAGGGSRRRAERILAASPVSKLPDLSGEEIGAAVDALAEQEGLVSEERRRIHGVIDALEAELLSRYKAGLTPPV